VRLLGTRRSTDNAVPHIMLNRSCPGTTGCDPQPRFAGGDPNILTRNGEPLTRLARVLALLSIIPVLACARRAEPDFEQRGPPPPGTDFSASGPLRYEGRVVPTGNRARPLRAALIARNPGPDTVSVSYGECSFGLYAYREPVVSVAPVWDNRPPPLSECLLIGYEAAIPPGGTETFPVAPSGKPPRVRSDTRAGAVLFRNWLPRPGWAVHDRPCW
jgi:hypothetical protein